MAVTSPDNIRTPDSGDQYALVQDLGVLADTTQAAITKRGNMYVGTASQRIAFTTASNGVHWQDTDGTGAEYVRQAGSWLMLGSKSYSGTSAQRVAFTTAPNGSIWVDTDGDKSVYRGDGSSWVLLSVDVPLNATTVFSAGVGSTITADSKIFRRGNTLWGQLAVSRTSDFTSGLVVATANPGYRPPSTVDLVGLLSGGGVSTTGLSTYNAAGVVTNWAAASGNRKLGVSFQFGLA